MTNKEKLAMARDQVFDNHPYFASIVASWKVYETSRIQTAATDGPNLYYNPAFLQALTVRETVDLLLHEAGHIFLGHHFRFEGKSAKQWNVAADLALNDHIEPYLDRNGVVYQEGVFPGRVQRDPRTGRENHTFEKLEKGRTAEWYLSAVHQMVEKVREEQQKMGTGTPTQGKGEKSNQKGSTAPTSADEDDESQDEQQSSDESDDSDGDEQSEGDSKGDSADDDGKDEDKAGGKGSGSSDDSDDAEDPAEANLPPSIGDVLPHPILDSEDEQKIEEAKQDWEQTVAEGINAAKKMGNTPGWATEAAGIYAHTDKMDVEALTRSFLTSYAPTMTSYSRPNRRTSYRQDVIMPAQRARDLAPGCVIVDCSGSMSAREMNLGLEFIEKALLLFPYCKMTLKQADTREIPEGERQFTRFDFPLRIPHTWMGRGGTNLTPAITAAAKSGKYEWLIVISDMEWRSDQCPDPKIPTLWLVTKETNYYYGKPTFGQLVGPLLDGED